MNPLPPCPAYETSPQGLVLWTEILETWLRAAWATGLSANAIGDLAGMGKNRIIGKARRLGLPARPQNGGYKDDSALWPEERLATLRALWADPALFIDDIGAKMGVGGDAVAYQARKMGLPARVARKAPAAITRAVGGNGQEIFAPPPPRVGSPAPSPAPAPYVFTRSGQCTFLIGDDRRTWARCTEPAPLGSSWCNCHRAVVFVRRKTAVASISQGDGIGRANAGRERLWYSPACLPPVTRDLFADAAQ